MCIDIVEICFGIADGHISSIFDSYLPMTRPYFNFWTITLVNISGFSPNLLCVLILSTSVLGMLMSNFVYFGQSYLPAIHPYFTFRTIT